MRIARRRAKTMNIYHNTCSAIMNTQSDFHANNAAITDAASEGASYRSVVPHEQLIIQKWRTNYVRS